MNDIQVLTIAVSLIVPISFLLLSNSRITDAKETLRAETQSTKETLRAEIQSTKAEILHRLDRMEDNLTRLLADHDQRLTKLEGGQR